MESMPMAESVDPILMACFTYPLISTLQRYVVALDGRKYTNVPSDVIPRTLPPVQLAALGTDPVGSVMVTIEPPDAMRRAESGMLHFAYRVISELRVRVPEPAV